MSFFKGVQMTTKRALLKIKGLSETKVDKIKEAALKIEANTSYTHIYVCHA